MRQLAHPRTVVTVVILGVIGTSAVVAAQKPVTASEGWVKLSAAGETTASAFVVIDNPTMYDVYVVAAATDVAGEVQFRETSPAAAGKTAVVKEITAPAYGRVELKPDGVHLLLTGLKRPLEAGETLTVTLTTDGGLVLSVPAIVRPE